MNSKKNSTELKTIQVPARQFGKNFRTAPYLIMHVHLTGDTLNNKAPYMDV